MPSFSARTRKTFFISFGFVTLSLGIVGIFLPILPTTPFLLLSAWAWMKSSGRFYSWLIHNRLLGTYIRNYREKRGITVRHKIITLAVLWTGIGYTAIFVSERLWLTLLLFAIAAGVTAHLLLLKTLPAGKENRDRQPPDGAGPGKK
ncbi:MAG: YbaN family protein [Spirochaetales bacterium]|nr:YbaN family protein [Spirochaetales bacterium]